MLGPNPYAAPSAPPNVHQGKIDANVALVLALASVFFCAPILSPIALWKASRALRVASSWQGTMALVLAGLGLFSSAFFWLLAVWQYLAPAR